MVGLDDMWSRLTFSEKEVQCRCAHNSEVSIYRLAGNFFSEKNREHGSSGMHFQAAMETCERAKNLRRWREHPITLIK